jgi:hypothetical protein
MMQLVQGRPLVAISVQYDLHAAAFSISVISGLMSVALLPGPIGVSRQYHRTGCKLADAWRAWGSAERRHGTVGAVD